MMSWRGQEKCLAPKLSLSRQSTKMNFWLTLVCSTMIKICSTCNFQKVKNWCPKTRLLPSKKKRKRRRYRPSLKAALTLIHNKDLVTNLGKIFSVSWPMRKSGWRRSKNPSITRQPSSLTGTIHCFAQATSTPAVCTEMLSCHLRFCSTLSCLRLPQKSKKASFDAWYRMLEVSITYGKTYIITNAAQGWVEFSAEKFMPSVVPILSKINIISARARYES